MTDEHLEQLVTEALAKDQVPMAAIELAKSIPDIARADLELAEWAMPAGATRDDAAGDAGPAIFSAGELTLLVDMEGDGLSVDPVGVEVVAITLETAAGNSFPLAESAGRFQLVSPVDEDLAGPARLVAKTDDGQSIGTDWFTLR